MEKEVKPPAKPSQNIVVRFGLWVTIISAALYAGGRLISKIDEYLPYAFGVGIIAMTLGLLMDYRAKNRPGRTEP